MGNNGYNPRYKTELTRSFNYMRTCKRCHKIYRACGKLSKICPDCDRSTRNKVINKNG